MATHDMSRSQGSERDRLGVPRDDAEAILAARQELGQEYDPALVDAFVDRVDAAIDARVQQRVDEQLKRRGRGSAPSLTLPLISLVFAIPLSGIAGGTGQVPGLILVWSAIVLINIIHAVRRPR